MSDALVMTEGLTKRYGAFTALDGCTLAVRRGEIFGLLGPNGSGKTTFIRLLLGFLEPTSGGAWIDGQDCYRDSVSVHDKLSYLPGEARLPPRLRGKEVLRFFADVRPRGSLERSLALADRLQLDLSRQVAMMSTGMRQKLALAAAMSADTPLVILDEPTSNLDPTVRSEVIAIVREARAAGRTVIFSSHVLSEVEQSCDRVAILKRGKLVHEQIVAKLRRQHRIRALLKGLLPAPPGHLAEELNVRVGDAGQLSIETPGELSPLLGWLAQVPMSEVHIEPIGLQAVYDRFHASEPA